MSRHIYALKALVVLCTLSVISLTACGQVAPPVTRAAAAAASRALTGRAVLTGERIAAEEVLAADAEALALRGRTRALPTLTGAVEAFGAERTFLSATEQPVVIEWFTRFCAGDAKAFEPLATQLKSPVGRYFRGARRTAAEVEELTQDVLVRVWVAQQLGHCPERMAEVGGWLYRVSQNLNISLARTSGDRIMRNAIYFDSRFAEFDGKRFASLAGTAGSEEDAHLTVLCVGSVVASFGRLERKIAEGLVEGMTQQAIAEHLLLSNATVNRRVKIIKWALEECR